MKRSAKIVILIMFMFSLLSAFPASAEPVQEAGVYIQPVSARTDVNINSTWKFYRGDAPSAEAADFNDTSWNSLNLPHTWNNLDGQDGGNNYYRGIGWYRKNLTIDNAYAGKRFYLQFDGANIVTDVYVNGKHLGTHSGGYAAFRFDATPYIKPGQSNVIAVKVNNAYDANIAPLSADYTFFGGLYRDVHLLVTDQVHLDLMDYGSPGVYLKQTNVSAASADLEVRAKIVNDSVNPKTVTVKATVVDAANQTVRTLSDVQTVQANTSLDFVKTTQISNPHLWNGLDDPYMYNVYVEVKDESGTLDFVSQPLGFRFFRLDANEGFFLNGKYLDLHGANRHQDRMNMGWALSNAEHLEDFMLMKEMGSTSIRLAHYQHAPYFYDLSDKNGMVIWAEIPVINSITESVPFYENAKQQLKELIRQNYNHPSIIFWSVANEITNAAGPDPTRLIRELNTLAKQEDATRLTTLGSNASDNHATHQFTDSIALNKYYGWYGGKISDIGAWADNIHAKNPNLKVGLSEYGAGSSVNIHSDNPVVNDHSEEYQNLFHEGYWLALKDRPFIWSKYVWNMFDFAVDSRNEGDTAGRNDKGLVTYDRKTKKDSFYWYKANWSKEPVIRITGKNGLTMKTPKDIKIYSNLDAVELKINGLSVGTKTSSDRIFQFQGVHLVDGMNTIEAIGTKDGQTYKDTAAWNSYTIGNGWTFVREDPSLYTLNPSNERYMKLTTAEGSLDGTASNDVKNILLRDPQKTDFTITTKMKYTPKTQFEWAGLIIYSDDDNFVSFGRDFIGGASKFRFSKEIGGTVTNNDNADPIAASPIVYLKIEKSGNTYKASYSTDGKNYTLSDTFTSVSLTNPRVGIMARKKGATAQDIEFLNFQVDGRIVPMIDQPLTSAEYKINQGTGTISGIQTTVSDFKSKVKAQEANVVKIYGTDSSTEVTDGRIGKGMRVSVLNPASGVLIKTYVITDVPISEGMPVTAKSEQFDSSGTNFMEYANDGNTNTRWAASNGTYPQWWEVDLGSVYRLSQWDTSWYRSNGRAYKYDVEVSNNGKDYTKVIDKTNNQQPDYTTDTFSAEGRYVRVNISGSTAGGFAGAYEFVARGSFIYSTDYTMDHEARTISGVREATSVDTFKKGISVATGASFLVYDSQLNEVTSGNMADNMIVIATGSNGVTKQDYTVHIQETDAPVKAVLKGPDKVQAGDSFDLAYGLEHVKDSIYAQDLTFTYDPDKVTYVAAKAARDGLSVTEKAEIGKVRILVASLGASQAVRDNGDLLKLSFKANPTLAPAQASITLSKASVADGIGGETTLDGASHSVQITASTMVDKEALKRLIAEAQSIHDAAVEGTGIGQYPAGAKAELLGGIHAANAVAGNVLASQEQVDQAAVALSRALQVFKASVITREPEDLNADGKVTIGDLAIAANYYGQTSSSPNWQQAKVADVNGDGKIDIADLAAIAKKILG